MIDWNQWSDIVDAAQDPQYRDAVQRFLAQADLSAEIPAALDEKVLAPRRSAGATGEECAYILCNLGFAALVAGSRESAEFAMGCGRLVEQLAPATPDLSLRRHFLLTKGALVLAVLADQPHISWDNAAGQCIAYLRAIDQELETLPAEGIESNAMAAYSFSAQLLSRIRKNHAVGHYADEVSQLVDVALGLSTRLPSTLISRVWSSIMPGTDTGVFFRQIGAAAERTLQLGEASSDHARKGLAYVDEVLSRSRDQSVPDTEQILQLKAELLLLSGRHTDAMDQAEALESASDHAFQKHAVVIKARYHLQQGDPKAAAELLEQAAPTAEEALENWRAAWMGDTSEGHWTNQSDAFPAAESDREIRRLQAVAAVDSNDMPGFLRAADHANGFLVGSLLQDSPIWADPMVTLDEIFARLVDGTALLQAINTDDGILTWVARKRDGEISQFVAPDRPSLNKLREAHKAWSRAYESEEEADIATSFSRLMDGLRRNWGDLLQELLEDGITQLILVGDDLVDIPLHATRTGSGNEPVIDRVPVTYVPSLSVLRSCIDRTPVEASRRKGIELRSLIDTGLEAGESVAETLGTKLFEPAPPSGASFWADVAVARVLHVVARLTHNARMPFDSMLGAGWLDLSLGQLVAELDLPQCDIVSNIACEAALPSTLRAPGFDLATIFLAAGARSVLASTWVARDDVASELVQSFFRHWVTGHAPSVAFREALLQVRSQRSSLPDFHWAGMRLVGAP